MRKMKRRSRIIGDEKIIFKHVIRKPVDYGEIKQTNLRSGVMDVSAELPFQDGDMRPVRQESARRSTRQDKLKARIDPRVHPVRHIDLLGMRASTALVMLCCLGFLLMFLHISDYARVSEAQKNVDNLRLRVERSQENIQTLEQKYETAAAGTNVAYEAKKHGLVSAKSVQAVELFVPANVEYSMADVVLVLPRDTLATILGD